MKLFLLSLIILVFRRGANALASSDLPGWFPKSVHPQQEATTETTCVTPTRTSAGTTQGASGKFPAHHESDVVIVGGGLAGLALFVGISRHLPQVSVTLLEQRPNYQEKAGATLGLAANGAKALKELSGNDSDMVTRIQDHGMDMSNVENIPVHVLPWWIVRDALLDQARSFASGDNNRVQLWNGVQLNDLEESKECVRVSFANTECVLKAKLVVAADGVRSTIRSKLGLPAAEDSDMRIWRGHVQVQDIDSKKHGVDHQSLDSLLDKGFSPFMIRDGMSYLMIFNHHDTIPGLLLWQLGTPLASDGDIGDIFQNLPADKQPTVDALLRQTPAIQYTKLSTINMDSISGGDTGIEGWGGSSRISLLGDAAHACRPTDGQGANMAFEDACVLVRQLVQHYKSGRTLLEVDDFVLQFENSRRPRVKLIHQDQAERAVKQGKDWTRWTPEMMKYVYDGV